MSSHERFEEWTHRSKRQIFMWPYAQISRLRAEIAALEAKVTEQAAEIARLREAVRDASVVLRYKGFNVVAWALRVPAVRRALEAKS